MRRLLTAAAVAGGLLAGAAGGLERAQAAGPQPVDLLFATPHLEPLPAGSVLRYGHRRRSEPAFRLGPDFEQAIRLETGEAGAAGGAVTITMNADAAPRVLDPFRGVPGNPMLMVFLESTVRAVSRATGGSPFYIRNRVREALSETLRSVPLILTAGTSRLPARELTTRPFEGDANAARMGPFAAMQLRFVVAEDAPGMLLLMRADTGPRAAPAGEDSAAEDAAGPVYFEEIRLELPE
ncbi:MAG: hypothetical protein AAF074_08375 [Pseudomonadota bacterium]